MQSIKQISIQLPCNQNWDSMSPTLGGRHCNTCHKTVVDFTVMSNTEILAYLGSTTNKTCGRFEKTQLDVIEIQQNSLSSTNWKKILLMATLLTSSVYAKATSIKIDPKTEQTPLNFSEKKVSNVDSVTYRTITGTITDANNNATLPGATIHLKGTTTSTTTDINGRFKITVPATSTELTVISLGYEQRPFRINNSAEQGTIALTMKPMILGEVIIKRPSFIKRVYYRFIKRPIIKIFG